MHPQRKKRLLLVVAALAIIGIASALILNAFRSNLVFFHTPTEVATKQVATDRTLRIGGLVVPGSIERSAGGLQVSFAVSDKVHSVPVRYQGILPDLFNEGKGTVVQGVLGADGVFQASQVLAKHDENYMPPEAADALERAGQTVEQP
ncbi:cytochrome c maturation protein CcmE [Aquitalea sp. S1-19]|nr:cytochrome c maturation protein CcmE [Aquitalea sp. S1-19]